MQNPDSDFKILFFFFWRNLSRRALNFDKMILAPVNVVVLTATFKGVVNHLVLFSVYSFPCISEPFCDQHAKVGHRNPYPLSCLSSELEVSKSFLYPSFTSNIHCSVLSGFGTSISFASIVFWCVPCYLIHNLC